MSGACEGARDVCDVVALWLVALDTRRLASSSGRGRCNERRRDLDGLSHLSCYPRVCDRSCDFRFVVRFVVGMSLGLRTTSRELGSVDTILHDTRTRVASVVSAVFYRHPSHGLGSLLCVCLW